MNLYSLNKAILLTLISILILNENIIISSLALGAILLGWALSVWYDTISGYNYHRQEKKRLQEKRRTNSLY